MQSDLWRERDANVGGGVSGVDDDMVGECC